MCNEELVYIYIMYCFTVLCLCLYTVYCVRYCWLCCLMLVDMQCLLYKVLCYCCLHLANNPEFAAQNEKNVREDEKYLYKFFKQQQLDGEGQTKKKTKKMKESDALDGIDTLLGEGTGMVGLGVPYSCVIIM